MAEILLLLFLEVHLSFSLGWVVVGGLLVVGDGGWSLVVSVDRVVGFAKSFLCHTHLSTVQVELEL